MTKENLKEMKGLPSYEDLVVAYAHSPETVLKECLQFQNIPHKRWKDRDIEQYLLNPWIPIPWTGSKLKKNTPFGYEKDEKRARELGLDPDSILFPIPDELFELEHAKELIRRYSVESVANWLSQKTGRSITEYGLRKRIHAEKTRGNRANFYRKLATRIAKALISAEKIEAEFPGAKAPWIRKRNVRKDRRVQLDSNKRVQDLFNTLDPKPYVEQVRREELSRS